MASGNARLEAPRGDAGVFDYVIVGAGSAGCCLANRLSADPGVSVALLEAGGKDSWHWIHIPVGYLYTQNTPRTDWCYKTEAEPGLNGRALNYPRGRVLGGWARPYLAGLAREPSASGASKRLRELDLQVDHAFAGADHGVTGAADGVDVGLNLGAVAEHRPDGRRHTAR